MPQLRVLLGHQQGHVFSLGEQPVVIGRHPHAQVVLHTESRASRKHAEIYRDCGCWRLRDLGSVNGTELNGRIARDEPLADRDEIVIGDNVFVFENSDGDAAAIAEAATHANAVETTGAHNTPEVQELVGEMDARTMRLEREVAKVVIGHSDVIHEMLTALLAGGHMILRGVPGLAKTTLIRAVAEALGLKFSRVHFTPDLTPADVIGNEMTPADEPLGTGAARLVRGPVFTNVFLADELQNAQPRTQTALLDAMMDGAVNALGRAWRLEPPFFVVATQNPDASTPTALSDAQLDRFMFSGDIGYPSEADEAQIAMSPAPLSVAKLGAVFSHKEIALLQSAVADIPVCEHLVHYAVRIVRATRPGDEHAPGIVTKYVERGAGPRAAHHLVTAAKAAAVLTGRLHVTAADIRAVAQPVLRHRIDLNSAAKPGGVNGDAIVQCLLIEFPEPEG